MAELKSAACFDYQKGIKGFIKLQRGLETDSSNFPALSPAAVCPGYQSICDGRSRGGGIGSQAVFNGCGRWRIGAGRLVWARGRQCFRNRRAVKPEATDAPVRSALQHPKR